MNVKKISLTETLIRVITGGGLKRYWSEYKLSVITRVTSGALVYRQILLLIIMCYILIIR